MEQSKTKEQKKTSKLKRTQSVDITDSSNIQEKPLNKQIDSQKNYESSGQIQMRSHSSNKTKQQTKIQNSLQEISVESPLMKVNPKNQQKYSQKQGFYQNKVHQNYQKSHQKLKTNNYPSSSKNIVQSNMKQTLKSSYRPKKVNTPIYEETFYITGMKQNYLLLLNDNNQVLQFPVGMFTTQAGLNSHRDSNDNEQNDTADRFHLMKDIKIGQPIKIKLQLDIFRQQKDEKIFNSLQKKINADYSAKDENLKENKGKQASKLKN